MIIEIFAGLTAGLLRRSDFDLRHELPGIVEVAKHLHAADHP